MGKIKVPSWDDYFMKMVYGASEKSKDERTHIGAVVVGPNNEIRTTGYNSFPRGIRDDVKERQEKPEKYFWFAHAENNAIYNAAFMGTSLRGCKMYTNGVPCTTCAMGIVNSGIIEVIVDYEWNKRWADHDQMWVEHAKRTRIMFKERGVKLRSWKGCYDRVSGLMSGKPFP